MTYSQSTRLTFTQLYLLSAFLMPITCSWFTMGIQFFQRSWLYLWVYLHVWVLVIIKVHWHQRERTPVINIRNGNSVTWLTRDGLVVVPHLKDDKWNVPVAMGKILCTLGVYSLPSHIGVDPRVGGTHRPTPLWEGGSMLSEYTITTLAIVSEFEKRSKRLVTQWKCPRRLRIKHNCWSLSINRGLHPWCRTHPKLINWYIP